MEIFKNFGIDPLLLLAQVVNFLILLAILRKFFLDRILKFLKTREEKIKKGVEAGIKGEELLEKAKLQQKEMLNAARIEAELLLANSQKMAQELTVELKIKAEKEADRIIVQARNQAQVESDRIEKSLEEKTVKIAIAVVEAALKNLLKAEDQKRIIENLSKKIRA